MKSLREIFWSLSKSADKWDPYFDVYETWFSKFRNKSPRVLEIGVQNGGSADMWLEFFGQGTQLVGVDIDPRCLQHAKKDLHVVIGDQGSENFWQDFFKVHSQPFDIVIDDGSHRMHDMKLTFAMVNQHVADGGIYLIEDTHTAYWNNDTIFPDIPTGALKNHGLYNPNNVYEFTKMAADVLNKEHIESYKDRIEQLDQLVVSLFKNVKSLHYYNSMIVFEIGKQAEFKRCINSGVRMA
jgi:SAM-dependent methyltransferase